MQSNFVWVLQTVVDLLSEAKQGPLSGDRDLAWINIVLLNAGHLADGINRKCKK